MKTECNIKSVNIYYVVVGYLIINGTRRPIEKEVYREYFDSPAQTLKQLDHE